MTDDTIKWLAADIGETLCIIAFWWFMARAVKAACSGDNKR